MDTTCYRPSCKKNGFDCLWKSHFNSGFSSKKTFTISQDSDSDICVTPSYRALEYVLYLGRERYSAWSANVLLWFRLKTVIEVIQIQFNRSVVTRNALKIEILR